MLLWLLLFFAAHFDSANGCMPPTELLFYFFDASAKIPTAMMSLNVVDFGAFDQCLALDKTVNGIQYRGQYCLIKIPMPLDLISSANTLGRLAAAAALAHQNGVVKVEDRGQVSTWDQGPFGMLLGWCIPDSCPVQNVTQTVMNMIQSLPPSLPVPEFIKNLTIYPFMGGFCRTKASLEMEATKFSGADIGAIAFLSIILCIMALSTIYDLYVRYRNRKPAHILLTAFSVRTNGEKLLTVSHHPDQLPCLHGLRFISMMWVMFGHRYSTMSSEPNLNLAVMQDWKADPFHMYIMGATVSVDTFFFLSGLLVCYGFLLAKAKGVRFNVVQYWIHRYIRLTPALAVVILVVATLLNRLGSGPFWPLMPYVHQVNCQDNWWPVIGYIQNYYKTEKMCLGHTWYLAIDFQLFLLSPLVLIPLWRWPKRTLYTCLALVFGCVVSGFVVSYHFDLPASVLDATNSVDYGTKYYVPTHTRYGPWLIGLVLGYYIFILKKRNDTEYKLHPAQVAAGWLLALTLLLTVVFASHKTLYTHDRVANAFFNGLHRHVWALGLCWVVYACTQGYGGPINAFLSWAPFQVLGRFTYTMYLIHEILQGLMLGTARTNMYFTDFNMMYRYWGDLFLTLALSVCLTLSFESPILVIEKVIFGTGRAKKSDLPVHRETINPPSTSRTDTQPCQNEKSK